MTTDTLSIHGKSLVGNTLSHEGTGTFQGINPAHGEPLEGLFYEATLSEIETACSLSEKAFHTYSNWEGSRRASFLKSISQQILALGDTLLERAHAETGLPMARLQGERARTMHQLTLFAELLEEGSWVNARIDRAIPQREPLPKPDVRQMLVPLGPVAVFGASNFPLAYSVAGGDTASALAAGCPVVFKAHPAHPGTSELVATAILKAVKEVSAPEGVFSLLQGTDYKMNTALVQNSHIKAVGFTGSLTGGRALMDAASARPDPIPVFAEMGSNNPLFLLPKAIEKNSETIINGLVTSLTNGAGQFCTCPGLVALVKGEASENFITELAKQVKACEPGVTVHAGIKSNYDHTLSSKVSEPQVEMISQSADGDGYKETQVKPALLKTTASHFLNQPDLQKELFGPGALIIVCENQNEMNRVAASLEGSLTGTLHADESELSEWSQLKNLLQTKVGRLIYNGFPTGVEVCPSMQHGGPYPASSDSRSTSVGSGAITRFARPVSFQNCPDAHLPDELKNANPHNIWRLVDGEFKKD